MTIYENTYYESKGVSIILENKFTPDLLEKDKAAKSEEELIAIAKENNVELTDEQLTNVTGGVTYIKGSPTTQSLSTCDYWIGKYEGLEAYCENCKYFIVKYGWALCECPKKTFSYVQRHKTCKGTL